MFSEGVPHYLSHEARLLGHHQSHSPLGAAASAHILSPPPPQQWRDSPYDILMKKTSRRTSIESLPDEALLRILQFLPTNFLCRCARVCTRWYNLVWREPTLWTRICINDENLNVDKALKILLRRLSQFTPHVCLTLETINLRRCIRLSDKGLHLIAKRCPELRQLEINGCRNVTNMALCEVVSRCVNLQHLNVTGR